MRIGSLFSGIGGLELGLEWAGCGQTAWQVERDLFCRRILARHWPAAERFDDVRHADASTLAPVDLVCGGFPCQDISTAGKGAGLAGPRSGLWVEFARIVGEVVPRFVVVENVARGRQRWLPTVQADLDRLGYVSAAFIVSAADVGAPHLRERCFVIATDRPGPAARLLADAHGEPVRVGPKRRPRGRPRKVRALEVPEPLDARAALANAVLARREGSESERASGRRGSTDGGSRGLRPMADAVSVRCDVEPTRGLHAHGSRGDDATRRGEFPPWRGDSLGWQRAIECGHPQPGIRRMVDGVPVRVDRSRRRVEREAIAALGNAVVPQVAEVIGRVVITIAELGA